MHMVRHLRLSLLALLAFCSLGAARAQDFPHASVDVPVFVSGAGEDAPVMNVSMFLGVEDLSSNSAALARRLAATLQTIFTEVNAVYAQCGIRIEVEAAQVVELPEHLLVVEANHKGSYGGHPPEEVENPERFTYDQNERLTDEARELFAYGKRHSSPNTVSIFVVGDVRYYIGDAEEPAGGVSFPPSVYHHQDDYPLRNSVLVVAYPLDPFLFSERTLWHELAHMLLDTGSHVADLANVLSGAGVGDEFTPEQCGKMQVNLERLYGEEQVVDPGRP